MGKLIGGLIKIVVGVVVLIAVFVVTKDMLVKTVVEKSVAAATGLQLEIGKLDIGLQSSHVGITDLNLLNPKGYQDRIMFSAPEIFVDYNLQDVLKGKIHLEEVRLNLKELVVIRNEQGQLNLDALKPEEKNKKEGSSESKESSSDTGQKAKAPEVQIDRLVLKVGKVVYKDYSKKGNPVVQEIPINIDETLEGVSTIEEMLNVVVQKALAKTALAGIANIDVDAMKDSAVQEAVGSMKEKVEALKDKIKLPFGNN